MPALLPDSPIGWHWSDAAGHDGIDIVHALAARVVAGHDETLAHFFIHPGSGVRSRQPLQQVQEVPANTLTADHHIVLPTPDLYRYENSADKLLRVCPEGWLVD
ncbi:MAG: hypothetical protein M3Y65_24670 [Pseudomonadota bacterium]|nr:hypothetical protein [Pseudomonadota bacterium]